MLSTYTEYNRTVKTVKQIATEQWRAAKWKLTPLSSFSYLAFPFLFVYEQVHFSPENETEKRRRESMSLSSTQRMRLCEGVYPNYRFA